MPQGRAVLTVPPAAASQSGSGSSPAGSAHPSPVVHAVDGDTSIDAMAPLLLHVPGDPAAGRGVYGTRSQSLAGRRPQQELARVRLAYFQGGTAHRAMLAARLRADAGVRYSIQHDVGEPQPTDYPKLLDWLDPASRRSSWRKHVSRTSQTSRTSTEEGGEVEDCEERIEWDVFRRYFLLFSQHGEAESMRPAPTGSHFTRRGLVSFGDASLSRNRIRAVVRRVIAKYDAGPVFGGDDDPLPPDPSLSPMVTPRDGYTGHSRCSVGFCRPKTWGTTALAVGTAAMALIGPALSPLLPAPGDGVTMPVGRNASARALLLGCWTAQALHLLFLSCMTMSFIVLATSGNVAEVRAAALRWICSERGFTVAVVTGVCSGVGSSCWTLAFLQTSIPEAYVFNALPPLLVMLLRAGSGVVSDTLEVIGVALCLLGALSSIGLASSTPLAPSPIAGAALAGVSSVTNTVCLISGKHAADIVPTVVYLAGVTLFSAAAQLVLTPCIVHDVTFSRDPEMGLFGWTSRENEESGFHWVVVLFALGQWGVFSALRSVAVFRVSIALAVVPVVATLGSVLIFRHPGATLLAPGSAVGGAMIIAGTVLLVVGGGKHQEADAALDSNDEGVAEYYAAPDTPGSPAPHRRPLLSELP